MDSSSVAPSECNHSSESKGASDFATTSPSKSSDVMEFELSFSGDCGEADDDSLDAGIEPAKTLRRSGHASALSP